MEARFFDDPQRVLFWGASASFLMVILGLVLALRKVPKGQSRFFRRDLQSVTWMLAIGHVCGAISSANGPNVITFYLVTLFVSLVSFFQAWN
jgi:hypothetical protein